MKSLKPWLALSAICLLCISARGADPEITLGKSWLQIGDTKIASSTKIEEGGHVFSDGKRVFVYSSQGPTPYEAEQQLSAYPKPGQTRLWIYKLPKKENVLQLKAFDGKVWVLSQPDYRDENTKLTILDAATGKEQPPLRFSDKPLAQGFRRIASAIAPTPGGFYCLTQVIKPVEHEEWATQEFELHYFESNATKPKWSDEFAAESELGYRGGYLMAAAYPNIASASIQQLTPTPEGVLLCAGPAQPIVFVKEDGKVSWSLGHVWEYERGFIGPSVWAHTLARFNSALGDAFFSREQGQKEDERVVELREEFDKQWECELIAGPIYVPAKNKEDWPSGNRIFVAYSKSKKQSWSGYVADCFMVEISDEGSPLSVTPLPRAVSSAYVWHNTSFWGGQERTLFEMSPSENGGFIGMGPGGADCVGRISWLRQLAKPEVNAWLRADSPMRIPSFFEGLAWLPSDGLIIDKQGDTAMRTPVAAIDLRDGNSKEILAWVESNVPLPFPETNYSGNGKTVRTLGPYKIAVTSIFPTKDKLWVTYGLEGHAVTFGYPIEAVHKALGF